MPYSDFDLRTALQAFGLQQGIDADLFDATQPLTPTPFLQVWLDEFAPVAVGVNTEKARSEFIIAPFLAEAHRRSAGPYTVMPGIQLDVDRARGLTGFCDFVVAHTPGHYFLRGPLLIVVEAKREDIIGGLGQCAASMVALREFNERDGTPVEAVYGAVTSGTVWRFLKLTGTLLAIDRVEYYLRDAAKIVGILVEMGGNGVRPLTPAA